MRTVTYTCNRCGKKMSTIHATKLNITLQRGKDSVEKEFLDFCSPCFLKMKKAWKNALSGEELAETSKQKSVTVKEDTKSEPANVDEHKATKSSISSEITPKKHVDEYKATESSITSETVPKKRGRKPKPVNPEEWLTRTEMAHGAIKAPEKEFILKLHVEDGLSPDEIAQKLHRSPKGINQAINSAAKSGELDKLKAKVEATKESEKTSDTEMPDFYTRRSSYVMPANTEVIDNIKYDIGGIMALHNAGWPPSEIAKEKGYDEDVVRVILENHTK